MNNHDNLTVKINLLEKEKVSLENELKDKEEYYRSEVEKLEKSYETYQNAEFNKYENEKTSHSQTKKKLTELESN